MTTWDVLNQQLSYFLQDVPKAGTALKHVLPLRVAAWNWSQRMFCQHTAREMVIDPIPMQPDKRTFPLPLDFFEVGSIWDKVHFVFYLKAHFVAGGFRSPLDQNPTWWIWNDTIHFERTVSEYLTLYYYATWPDVKLRTNEAGELEVIEGQIFVPAWAESALVHLTAAYLLQPLAIDSARNREFNIKIDSGTPTDNARASQAREHLFWYHELLGQYPVQNRLGGVGYE